jgi:putative ABC transport system permease protein
MLIHIFKIISRQWRMNLWLVLELVLVFPLMWYITDFFSVLYFSSRLPVGFDIENTYVVHYETLQSDNPRYVTYPEGSDEPRQNFSRMVERIRQYPAVEAVSIGQWHYPYAPANMNSSYSRDSLLEWPRVLSVTPAYFEVFRVAPSGGGEPAQLAAAIQRGAVISRTLEEKLFPGQRATGGYIRHDSTDVLVAGVSNALKRQLFTRPQPCIYLPFEEHLLAQKTEKEIWQWMNICIRIRPGYEEKAFIESFKQEMKTQLALGNYFLADLTPLHQMKTLLLKRYGVYESIQYRCGFAVFFLINIFLGVIGTFWLSIKKRKEEIGLRIALGSERKGIIKQMIAESFLLLLIASMPGLLICVNLSMAGIMPVEDLDFTLLRFVVDTLATFGVLALVIALATGYPALRASAFPPAEALRS